MILDGNYWSSLSSGPLKEAFYSSQFLSTTFPLPAFCLLERLLDFSKVTFCPLCFFHFGTHGEMGKRKRNGKKEEKWEKGRETGTHPCGQADEQENDVWGVAGN